MARFDYLDPEMMTEPARSQFDGAYLAWIVLFLIVFWGILWIVFDRHDRKHRKGRYRYPEE